MASDVGDFVIRPLSVETWDSLAGLFAQGGDPKTCWCMYWRVIGKAWSDASPEAKRTQLEHLADVGDFAPGLVALRDEEAIGWVSLGPRDDFERLERSGTISRPPGDGVWSVVCFVVGRHARGSGVAAELLEAAVEHARSHGARALEAYPVRTDGERITSAAAYTGTLGMFERAGFTEIADTRSKAEGHIRVVVRRDLALP